MIKCLNSFTENQCWFTPAGFQVITSGMRCVVLIWADNQIRTLKFEDIAASVKTNTAYQKVYDYKFEDDCAVLSIVSTATNTFGLLEDGRIFYFVSFRAVEIIPDLGNVRAICKSENGFVLMRNISPVDVFIEFYSDRSSSEMLKKYKKIPIGWNEKWTFERSSERSVLCLVRNEEDSPIARLFAKLIDGEVEVHSKIVLFSVNSSLFGIFYENAKDVQSDVCQIRTFLTDIKSVWIFSSGIMCILLEGGVIDILYEDSEGHLKEDSFYSGMDIQAHSFDLEDECVYLSDGRLCIRATFLRGSKVSWTIERYDLSGIIGFSYLPALKVVLCLSENCFIYTIDHKQPDSSDTEPLTGKEVDLGELKADLAELTDRTGSLSEEAAKSTAINVILNPQVIQDNCRICLTFTPNCGYYEMPAMADRLSDQSYDVQLELKFNEELAGIFKAFAWSLTVLVRGLESYQEVISIDEEFMKCNRVKIMRECARNNGTLASDLDISIQGFLGQAENLLVDIPLAVTYNLSPLIQILEEDPLEMVGKYKFHLESDKRAVMNKILALIIEFRISSEPFVIAIGRSAIVVHVDDCQSEFSSDDQAALQLFKKLLLLQAQNLKIWSQVEYGPKERISLCELTGRHALFGDETVDGTLDEIYKDIRNCVIKLS